MCVQLLNFLNILLENASAHGYFLAKPPLIDIHVKAHIILGVFLVLTLGLGALHSNLLKW